MENTIGKQIAGKVFTQIAPEYSGNKTIQTAYSNFKTQISKDLPEEETKEATGSASSGGYTEPLFGDVKEDEDYTKKAKNNIDGVLGDLPKLKDLKPYGLKYSVKSIKNLLVPKTREDGTFKDNRWVRDEMPFPKELDILNVLLQSRLSEFYFKKQAKKRNKSHYLWAQDINKEDLDNFPIPEIIFNTVSEILKGGEKSKKEETKEATSSSSSGSYVQPAIWAKSSTKKHWKGARRPQIPGGKFVEVKRKCQTFPYCNQGDIKSLKIFENNSLMEVIRTISKNHNISENVIKNILNYELEIKK